LSAAKLIQKIVEVMQCYDVKRVTNLCPFNNKPGKMQNAGKL